ncbi:MAG: hypothetical protein NVS1B12_11330 [Acidimicrobiales bacterium]
MSLRRTDAPEASWLGDGTWVLIAFLVGCAATLWIGPARWAHVVPAGPHLGWPFFTAMVAAGELLRVRFEFRRETAAITFWHVPLIFGLAYCGPLVVILSEIIGVAIRSLVRRHTPAQLAFNVAQGAVVAGVARVVFGALTPGRSVLDHRAWPAFGVALTVAYVVDTVSVATVIRLASGAASSGRGTLEGFFAFAALNLGVAASNGALGLIGLVVIAHEPWAALLLGVLALVFVAGYQAYNLLRHRYANLRLLYDFSATVAQTGNGGDVLHDVLTQAASLLNAEDALVMLPVAAGFLRVGLRNGTVTTAVVAHGDALTQALAASPAGLVFPRVQVLSTDPVHAVLHSHGWRDAVAVSLVTENDVSVGTETERGVFVVANRANAAKPFDGEDVRLLGALSNHAGVAIRNGQLLDRLQAEATTRAHQALHDALTGLGNRTMFGERLSDELANPDASSVAVMLMDLDEFKEINDTLGHHTGDAVLKQIASRLTRVVGPRGLVARLGGDEFVVAVPDCASATEAIGFAALIRGVLDEPIMIEELTLDIRASVGVALWPDHGSDPAALLQRADVAMYSAKASRQGVELYDPARDHYTPRRLSLGNDLRHAMETAQLFVVFQPKLDVSSMRVVGAEALLRWAHPDHGFVSPEEFIPVAEQSGLIGPLTRWVLRRSLEQAATWIAHGHDLTMAVNLSPRSLLDNELVADVARTLHSCGVAARHLVLELTETSVMSDPARSHVVLSELSDLGCGLAIDDFGTGYSSLSRLKQLPVDEVKIDKSFVLGMAADPDDATIVKSIIDLARNLGLKVVAEGVEDEATLRELNRLGCDQAQGYYMCRPVPAAEFDEWLAASSIDA